jgi:hypothetical protein
MFMYFNIFLVSVFPFIFYDVKFYLCKDGCIVLIVYILC